MPVRRCLDCGEVLKGRSDKKFCSDQCRNNYNNTINREANNLVRNVHSVLRKNRKILGELYEGGKKKVHRDALLVSEFNINFFTHSVETDDDSVITKYCYEYGYRELDSEYIVLVKNKALLEI
ncbi:MAG TPA: hypothetical protein ENH59_08285 [Bacteroidetes bacterium]|nr:hypothetical protein [Bacteroidota bacterium]